MLMCAFLCYPLGTISGMNTTLSGPGVPKTGPDAARSQFSVPTWIAAQTCVCVGV